MEYWVLVGGKGYLAKDASMAMDMLDYYSFLSQAFACVEGWEKRPVRLAVRKHSALENRQKMGATAPMVAR